MNRPHHSHLSKTERDKKLREFHTANQPNRIICGYRDGLIDAGTAYKRLESSTPQGILWAGELAIERAHRASDGDRALSYLFDAQKMFARVQEIGHMVSGSSTDAIIARAMVQSAHLPIHASVALEGKLPSKTVAEKAYRRTVTIGRALDEEHKVRRAKGGSRELDRMLGALAELGVLALLERIALLEIGPESWFPLLAHPSECRRNTVGSSLNHAWNISVFGNMAETPSLDYQVQVKNSGRVTEPLRPDAEGISLVCVDPDIRINPHEYYVASRAIEECFIEYTDPGHDRRISAHLYERTEKLLEKLDEKFKN